MLRWRVIAVLEAGRPYPVGETLIHQVADAADLQATQTEIRKALQYLSDKSFVELTAPRDGHWEARLLPAGVDYFEGNAEDDPGITRPPR